MPQRVLHDAPLVTQERVEWQVAVFCQNERSRIAACLTSIAASIGSRRGLITVSANGSTDESETVARVASAGLDTPVQVFSIPLCGQVERHQQFPP